MKSLLLILIFLSLLACKHLSPFEKEIRDNLKKEVNIKMINPIQKENEIISFDDLRFKYKYIYLVYLKDGCSPCYSTYVKWQKEMSSFSKSDIFTILFIIRGESYDEFIDEAILDGLEKDGFYTFMDTHDSFIKGNKDIPLSVISNSVLINKQNRIVLIGSSFSSPEMIKVFNEICAN